ncbi:MAG: hypothetical protein H0U59_13270 [Gemmatimonadaceae bacterium]|nr:hypothetical protein [Gemmatimonadaceae bacterium]
MRQSVDQWAGEPLKLEKWQKRWFREVLARDGDAPRWHSVALVVPRKNGKSTMLAAYALYSLLVGKGAPEILLAAASDKQAGRMFETVVSYVRVNPELAEKVHLREYIGEISRIDAPGKILRMSSDPSTLHGYNPSLVICDELAFWTKPGHRKAWAALTTGGGARRLTQVVTITVAGSAEEREHSILGQLIDANERVGELEREPGLLISRNTRANVLVYDYSAPTRDPHDVKAMKLANPASWIRLSFLQRQADNPELTPQEVLQLHGCVWVESVGIWISQDRWERCISKYEIPAGAEIVVGVDAAHARDTTAVTWTWQSPEGRFVQRTKVWSCIPSKPHHEFVPGGRLDNDAVRDFIREALVKRYSVRLVLYDERYFSDQAAELAETDDLVVAEMQQSQAEMRSAWSEFYDAINLGEPHLAHNGDPVYAEHVRNTVARKRDDGSWHVSKAAHERVIDAVAAGAMSLYGAKHLDALVPKRRSARLVSW